MFTLVLAATIAAPNPARHEKPSAEGLQVLLRPSDAPAPVSKPDASLAPLTVLSGTEFAVLKEEPGKVLLRNKGVDVWVARGDVMTPKEAIEFFTQRIVADPQYNNYVRRSKAHELAADWDAAIKDYDEVLKQTPQTSAYWNNRANYYSRKREYQKALDGYDEAIKLMPNNAHIPMGNRGNIYLNMREWDKALEAYDQSLKLNVGYARAYVGRATAWREKRDLDKAFAEAQRAVELEAASPHTLSARGFCWSLLKEYDKAFADFEEALRFDPLFATAYYGRAGVHIARKTYQPAIRDLETAMRILPKYAAAYTRRAEAWLGAGNPRKALSDLDEAIAADDRYPFAYRQKAWLLATHPDDTIRNGKEAVAAARKSLDLNKNAAGETWEALAAALAETGDFVGAVEWQTKAVADAWHVKQKGDDVKKRLASYEAKMPFRE